MTRTRSSRNPTPGERKTMKAIHRYSYGGPEVLRLAEVERPTPGDREVLVKVHAASINAADLFMMRGEPYMVRLALGLRTPRKPEQGRSVAGTVVAVGGAVSGIEPGTAVYAETDGGAFAEYAVVPQARLAPKPVNLSFEQAAAVPLAGTTALQGLRDVAGVKRGERVLINGASGGVGTFAVQIAKALGAQVTAVCSSRNRELVLSIGAADVVDYSREDFTAAGRRYDVVLDLIGNRSLSELRRALAPKGRLVLASSGSSRVWGPIGQLLRGLALSPFVGQQLKPLIATASGSSLLALTELIESGEVTPVIQRSYPLAETREAVQQLSDHHAQGKIVIVVD